MPFCTPVIFSAENFAVGITLEKNYIYLNGILFPGHRAMGRAHTHSHFIVYTARYTYRLQTRCAINEKEKYLLHFTGMKLFSYLLPPVKKTSQFKALFT